MIKGSKVTVIKEFSESIYREYERRGFPLSLVRLGDVLTIRSIQSIGVILVLYFEEITNPVVKSPLGDIEIGYHSAHFRLSVSDKCLPGCLIEILRHPYRVVSTDQFDRGKTWLPIPGRTLAKRG